MIATFPLADDSDGSAVTMDAGTGDAPRPHVGAPGADSPLGYCLVAPFRWSGKGDFAAAGGADLIYSVIAQIIGTRAASPGGDSPGEIRWRPDGGSLVDLLRHANIDDPSTQSLARVYVAEALRAWDPRITIRRLTVASIKIGVSYALKISTVYNVRASAARGAPLLVNDTAIDHTVEI